MLFLSVGVILSDLRPVDDVPPSLKIFRPAILVFQVVGVFPNVQTEEGLAAVHDGVVLIGRGFDGEFAVANEQPSPAGAEALGGLRRSGLVLKSAKLPKKEDLMAPARSPLGSPPPPFFIIFQNIESGSCGRRRYCEQRCGCSRALY